VWLLYCEGVSDWGKVRGKVNVRKGCCCCEGCFVVGRNCCYVVRGVL